MIQHSFEARFLVVGNKINTFLSAFRHFFAVRNWGLGFAPFRRAWAYGGPSYYAARGYGNNGDASAHGGESATHP
jgi:hypothetical protein